MSTSYNPNIPISTDRILQSAKQIRANFVAINAAFSVDHVGLTQNELISGKHQQLSLRAQNIDPATTADQIAIYNNITNALPINIPALFFRPNNSQTPIQLSYSSVQTGLQSADPDVYFTKQYSFMAGPFVIYGGFIPLPNNGTIVTLSPNTTLLAVFINSANAKVPLFSGLGIAFNINAINISGSSFTISLGGLGNGFVDIYYTAIGIPS